MPEYCKNCVHTPIFTRRDFLTRLGMGIGALGLGSLLSADSLLAGEVDSSLSPLAPKAPPFPAKAKRVLHIFAAGAPSQVDTWDPKPALVKYDGQSVGGRGVAMPSPFKFQRHGRCGMEVSEVFPRIAEHVDDIALIRSMYTDIPAHEIATVMMNTGSRQIPKPCLGSWSIYGLGSENQNMPGFISLHSGGGLPPGGTQNWGSAFLPGVYQGTSVNTQAATVDQMIENISSPYVSLTEQRRQLDLIHQLNELHAQNLQKDAQLEARIEAYEIAFRMQAEASDGFDYRKEPDVVQEAYGKTPQGRQMLIARRLLERGVRFVQIWAGGWDHHQDLETKLPDRAREIDQPLGALLADLKQKGMLDSTLVIWGGEFGRTPTRDRGGNATPGRDHNAKGFSLWMAGGGAKGGTIHGATDELGEAAVQDPVHIHDLHATILRMLGFDHTQLTYRYNGRDFRLTDVSGNVVKAVLA
ncbi:MAG TPA: DUF1501 domain-containing protein [Verrucomicrobiae bacterium]|jgi:hypothetical protein|nr:DUF1501 domain-containing protein [Verrucomicrobiae bacterium]